MLYRLVCVFMFLQVTLSNPVTENAVNMDAAEVVKNCVSLYRQMVLQFVRKNLHPEGNAVSFVVIIHK